MIFGNFKSAKAKTHQNSTGKLSIFQGINNLQKRRVRINFIRIACAVSFHLVFLEVDPFGRFHEISSHNIFSFESCERHLLDVLVFAPQDVHHDIWHLIHHHRKDHFFRCEQLVELAHTFIKARQEKRIYTR